MTSVLDVGGLFTVNKYFTVSPSRKYTPKPSLTMSALSATASTLIQDIAPAVAFIRPSSLIETVAAAQPLPFEQAPSVWDNLLQGSDAAGDSEWVVNNFLLELRGGARVVEKDGLKWSGRSRIIFEEVLKVTPKPFRIFPKNTMLKGLKKLGTETVNPKQVIDICKKSTPKKYLPKVTKAIDRVK